jgi:PEP-CTERM motif
MSITPLASAFPNDDYWVAVVLNAQSSINWWYGTVDRTGNIGEAGQASYYAYPADDLGNDGGDAIVLNGTSSVGGPYDLIVDTPEPATLAVLGSGLFGLGLLRRRVQKA